MKVVNDATQLMLRNLQEQTRRRHAAGEDSPFKASVKFRSAIADAVPESVADELIEMGIRTWAEKVVHDAGSEALDQLKDMFKVWAAAKKKAGATEVPDVRPFIESVLATWYMSIDFAHIAETLVEEFITNADTPVPPDMDLPMAPAVTPIAQDPTAVPGDVVAQLLRKMVDPSAN